MMTGIDCGGVWRRGGATRVKHNFPSGGYGLPVWTRGVLLAFVGAMGCLAPAVTGRAQVIFSENFNGLTGGTVNANQYLTGRPIQFGAALPGWDKAGGNAIHAVNRGGGDLAVMIFSGGLDPNIITLSTGIAANAPGMTYAVSFDLAAAAYSDGSQLTHAGDMLRFDVINGANTVLATYEVAPGTDLFSFNAGSFDYTGDGSGVVRYVITTANSNTVRFAGAVDNFTVSAIPEPATTAVIVGLGVLGWTMQRRRQGRQDAASSASS